MFDPCVHILDVVACGAMTPALLAPDPDELSRIRARIRGKSAALVEVGLEELYPILIDPETSAGTKLAILRDLSELGDLKPKKDAQAPQAGPGFSITINIPGNEGKPPIVLEGKVVDTEPLPPDDDSAITALAMPPYLTFDLDHDLMAPTPEPAA